MKLGIGFGKNQAAGEAATLAELVDFEAGMKAAKEKLGEVVEERAEGLADVTISMAQRIASGVGAQQARAADALRADGPAHVVLEASDDVPYAVGAEWGAEHDVARDTARGSVDGWNMLPLPNKDGYFLGPAADTLSDEQIETTVGPAVDDAMRPAFPD